MNCQNSPVDLQVRRKRGAISLTKGWVITPSLKLRYRVSSPAPPVATAMSRFCNDSTSSEILVIDFQIPPHCWLLSSELLFPRHLTHHALLHLHAAPAHHLEHLPHLRV